jgi:hypothetical protein
LDNINGPEGSRFGARAASARRAPSGSATAFTGCRCKTAFPCHTHTGNEEMIYVLGGNGVAIGPGRADVRAGTVVACLPGSTTLIN